MKKILYFVVASILVGGVSYFVYINYFSTRIILTNVSMPNVSFKYSHVPLTGTSIVFFNRDTGNSYIAPVRMNGSGETTVMSPTETPQGTYSLQIRSNQTSKKLAESDVFIVGPGAKPVVKIDKNTLIAKTHNPILSGTAQNISDISILVEDVNSRRYFGSELDISPANGGAWTVSLTDSSLPNGVYTIKIFNSRDDSMGILSSEIMTVSAQ